MKQMDDEATDLRGQIFARRGDPATGDMAVAQRWVGRTLVLTVTGDVDLLTAPVLADAITAAERQAPTAVLVDLSAVDFLASAGMTLLVTAQEELAPAIRFGVVADGPGTGRSLRLVGVDEHVALFRTLADALEGADQEA